MRDGGDGAAARGWRVTRSADVEAEEPATDVVFDLRLRPSRFLEVRDVELLVAAHPPEGVERPGGAARRVRHAQHAESGEHIRSEQGRVPGDRRSPVVTDDDGGLL